MWSVQAENDLDQSLNNIISLSIRLSQTSNLLSNKGFFLFPLDCAHEKIDVSMRKLFEGREVVQL